MTYIVMACIVMACIVMAYIVMAYIVMAQNGRAKRKSVGRDATVPCAGVGLFSSPSPTHRSSHLCA